MNAMLKIGAALAVVALSNGPLHGQPDSTLWNEFRGPNGVGVAEGCRPPTIIDAAKPAWKVPVPSGVSSPVFAGSSIILTAVDGKRLITLAYDRKTGRLRWRREAPDVPIERVHEASNPAASTPCTDEHRVYCYFGSYGLICYDHEGHEQWRKPIATPRSPYGTATSPIVDRDLLVLVLDTDAFLPGSKLRQSRILAINAPTGQTVWTTARPFHRSGWSTPTVWRHGGAAELVVLGSGRLCGYELATGYAKWRVNGFSRETVARPILGNGYVYGCASMLGGVADEHPDPTPYWQAVLQFDANHDDKLQRGEMTGPFTFPFRPELPPDHPGFGLPLPKDRVQRQKRLDAMFTHIDRNQDGFWTKEEFLANLSFNRAKPTLVAVRPGGQGDVSESHVVWALHRNIPEVPSPVFYRNRIYLVQDGGILSAIDASGGKVIYRKRLGAGGHYRASPVIADQHIYLLSQAGILSVAKTRDTFQLVHQHDFQQRVAATPAIDATTIYIRTDHHLFAFRNSGSSFRQAGTTSQAASISSQ